MITVRMQECAFLLLSGKLQEENWQEPQLQLHMQTGSIIWDIYMYYNLHWNSIEWVLLLIHFIEEEMNASI